MAAMRKLCHDKVEQECCAMKKLTYISDDGRELSSLDIMDMLESGELCPEDAKKFKCAECFNRTIYRRSKKARPHFYANHHDECSFRAKFHYYEDGKEREIKISFDKGPIKLSGSFFDDEDDSKDSIKRSGSGGSNPNAVEHESSRFHKFLLYLYLFSIDDYDDRCIVRKNNKMMFSDINYSNKTDREYFLSLNAGGYFFAEISSSREGEIYHFCNINLSDRSRAAIAIHKSKMINNPKIKAINLSKNSTARVVLIKIGRIDTKKGIVYAESQYDQKKRKYIERIMGTNLIVRDPSKLS